MGVRWLRPRPTRATGWALVFIAAVAVMLNLVMEFNNRHLLPGGHTPIYLLAGTAVGVLGLFVLGSEKV